MERKYVYYEGNIIEKDGVEIASTFHREVVTSDWKHLPDKIQRICELWLEN